MTKFKFYLDDNLLADEPVGWSDFTSEIIRDFDIHGLLVQVKATLTFTGDGFRYIDCVDKSRGFCSEIRVKIEELCSDDGQYELVFNGIIKVPDIQIELNKCIAKAPVIDNSYFARIKNNKDVKGFPHVGKTKNGVTITAPTAYDLKFFDPITGTYPVFSGIQYRKAYKVYDLMKFIIEFNSDDEVGFESTYFGAGGDMENLFITNGEHISTADTTVAASTDIGSISFQMMMDELYKLFNVGFYIVTTGPKPVFKLEKASDFYGTSVTDTLQNAFGVVKKTKVDQLYAILALGSDKTDDTPPLSFPENVAILGFKDEQPHVVGQCNTDKTLDLKGEFVRSSNVIEDTFMGVTANPQTAYDDDFFFIMGEPDGTGNFQAKQYDIFGIGALPYFYNGELTNDKIIQRFFGFIPNNIAQFFSNTDNTFLATRTSDSILYTLSLLFTIIDPCQFDDDYNAPNHDASNNYGNGTTQGNPVSQANSRYTVPSTGLYVFETLLKIQLTGQANILVWINRYDAANNLLIHYAKSFAISGAGIHDLLFTQSVPADATDYITVTLIAFKQNSSIATTIKIKTGSYFTCINTGSSGEFPTGDPEDYKATQYTFDYPISYSRFKNIKANAKDILAFNIDGINDFRPWIENFKYNHRTSRTELILLGQQKIQNCGSGFELREDGGFELREDGSRELRE